jgi:hypothetical protein
MTDTKDLTYAHIDFFCPANEKIGTVKSKEQKTQLHTGQVYSLYT